MHAHCQYCETPFGPQKGQSSAIGSVRVAIGFIQRLPLWNMSQYGILNEMTPAQLPLKR